MRAIIVMVFMIFITYGCHTLPKDYNIVNGKIIPTSDFNCDKFFNDIKGRWAVYSTKLKEGECYFYDENLVEEILENKNCFVGLKTEDIYLLLGEPSRISEHNFYYLLSKNCTNEYDYFNDKYHHLIFTALDTVGDVNYYPIVTDY